MIMSDGKGYVTYDDYHSIPTGLLIRVIIPNEDFDQLYSFFGIDFNTNNLDLGLDSVLGADHVICRECRLLGRNKAKDFITASLPGPDRDRALTLFKYFKSYNYLVHNVKIAHGSLGHNYECERTYLFSFLFGCLKYSYLNATPFNSPRSPGKKEALTL
jgi:hypothetical protein